MRPVPFIAVVTGCVLLGLTLGTLGVVYDIAAAVIKRPPRFAL